jgi:hypothetical protein
VGCREALSSDDSSGRSRQVIRSGLFPSRCFARKRKQAREREQEQEHQCASSRLKVGRHDPVKGSFAHHLFTRGKLAKRSSRKLGHIR